MYVVLLLLFSLFAVVCFCGCKRLEQGGTAVATNVLFHPFPLSDPPITGTIGVYYHTPVVGLLCNSLQHKYGNAILKTPTISLCYFFFFFNSKLLILGFYRWRCPIQAC